MKRINDQSGLDELLDILDSLSENPNFEQAIAQWLMTNMASFDPALLQRIRLEMIKHLK